MSTSENVRATSRIAPKADARPQADPARTLKHSTALRAMAGERSRPDFDADCAVSYTDAMTTDTRYSLLDAAVKAQSAGRYAADGVQRDGSRNCAERAKHEQVWSTNPKRCLDLWKGCAGWCPQRPASASLSRECGAGVAAIIPRTWDDGGHDGPRRCLLMPAKLRWRSTSASRKTPPRSRRRDEGAKTMSRDRTSDKHFGPEAQYFPLRARRWSSSSCYAFGTLLLRKASTTTENAGRFCLRVG